MIRQPTPKLDLLRWHAQALADRRAGLRFAVPQEPQCGWYERRLVKGGPLVGVSITMLQPLDPDGFLEADEKLQGWIAGNWVDPHEVWSYCADRPISEDEFTYLRARQAHASEWKPASPFANPAKPIDWLSCELPTF